MTKPKAATATIATSSWRPNLTIGRTGQRSSAMRRIVARAETTTTPVASTLCGTSTITATAKPRNMASPPSSGVGWRCGCLGLGIAIRPVRRESLIISGVAATQITNASSSGHRPGSRRSRRVVRKSTLKKSDKLLEGVGQRESPAELEGALVHRVANRRVVDVLDQVGETVGDHPHLGLFHAARRDQRRAHADSAGVELRCIVVRDGVAVERDADRVGDVLHLLARPLLRPQVDEHQVVVGA